MTESEIAGKLFFFDTAGSAAGKDRSSGEAELILRARSGENDAFTELYRMFAPMVHGVVLARVPFDDVQDIVQEVFLAAFRNLAGFRNESSFGAWLGSIARNHAADHYRRSKPQESLIEEFRGKECRRAEANEVMAAIRSLPITYRETLILRLVEGMTGQEIAERAGMTPGSVRVNLHRGMELLRQELGIKR